MQSTVVYGFVSQERLAFWEVGKEPGFVTSRPFIVSPHVVFGLLWAVLLSIHSATRRSLLMVDWLMSSWLIAMLARHDGGRIGTGTGFLSICIFAGFRFV
jgi:hypothetical protein